MGDIIDIKTGKSGIMESNRHVTNENKLSVPDQIIQDCIGKYKSVVVIGVDKDSGIVCRSSVTEDSIARLTLTVLKDLLTDHELTKAKP